MVLWLLIRIFFVMLMVGRLMIMFRCVVIFSFCGCVMLWLLMRISFGILGNCFSVCSMVGSLWNESSLGMYGMCVGRCVIILVSGCMVVVLSSMVVVWVMVLFFLKLILMLVIRCGGGVLFCNCMWVVSFCCSWCV